MLTLITISKYVYVLPSHLKWMNKKYISVLLLQLVCYLVYLYIFNMQDSYNKGSLLYLCLFSKSTLLPRTRQQTKKYKAIKNCTPVSDMNHLLHVWAGFNLTRRSLRLSTHLNKLGLKVPAQALKNKFELKIQAPTSSSACLFVETIK